MSVDLKIATVITPYFIKKPDRNHLNNIINGLVHLNVIFRSNGNGGTDNVVNKSVPNPNKLFYLPSQPFYSLESQIELPIANKEGEEFLNKIFKGYDKFPEDKKMRLRASLYSLAGTTLQRHSDIAIVLRCKSYSKHPVNHELYKGAIRIANELGIHIVNINSRVKEVIKNDNSESESGKES